MRPVITYACAFYLCWHVAGDCYKLGEAVIVSLLCNARGDLRKAMPQAGQQVGASTTRARCHLEQIHILCGLVHKVTVTVHADCCTRGVKVRTSAHIQPRYPNSDVFRFEDVRGSSMG